MQQCTSEYTSHKPTKTHCDTPNVYTKTTKTLFSNMAKLLLVKIICFIAQFMEFVRQRF